QRSGLGLSCLEVLTGGDGITMVQDTDPLVQRQRGERSAQRGGSVGRADATAVAAHTLVGAEAEPGDLETGLGLPGAACCRGRPGAAGTADIGEDGRGIRSAAYPLVPAGVLRAVAVDPPAPGPFRADGAGGRPGSRGVRCC